MEIQGKRLLQDVLDRAVDAKDVAGINVLAVKDGHEVYAEAGYASIEQKRRIQRNTIFRLFSQTKPVTAAAAMMLMERGLIDLIQPVSDFLPAYKDLRYNENGVEKAVKRPMLVQDLLNMTSGLVYPEDNSPAGLQTAKLFEEVNRRMGTPEEMTTRQVADGLAGCVLRFEPGSRFYYGTSADVLAAVVEVVSGMRFGDFLRKEIFEPLGMNDTGFYVTPDQKERLAEVYTTVDTPDGGRELKLFNGTNVGIANCRDRAPGYEAGGGGLVSTADDYMKFAQMLLGGGQWNGTRILQPETVRVMTTGKLMHWQQDSFTTFWHGLCGYSYGNLMRVCKDPSQTGYPAKKDEYGWDGWLGAYFANFPNENMTITMYMSKTDAGTFDLTRKVRNVLLTQIF